MAANHMQTTTESATVPVEPLYRARCGDGLVYSTPAYTIEQPITIEEVHETTDGLQFDCTGPRNAWYVLTVDEDGIHMHYPLNDHTHEITGYEIVIGPGLEN